MTDLAWQKLEQFLRHAAPSLATFLLVLLSVTPLPIPSYGSVAPVLPMIAIYYWAAHRPDLLPFSVVFVAGLLHDILSGGPLGLHSFVFLICQFLDGPYRNHREGIIVDCFESIFLVYGFRK